MTITETTSPDPFTAPDSLDGLGASVKTYRVHACHRLHPTYRSWAQCTWPSAAWISGEGKHAVISRCRAGSPTVACTPTRTGHELRWPCSTDHSAAVSAVERTSWCGSSCTDLCQHNNCQPTNQGEP